MINKIQVILEVTNTKQDINGNKYYVAKIINPLNGKSIAWHTPHVANAKRDVKQILNLDSDNIYLLESEVSKKEFRRLFDSLLGGYSIGIEELGKYIKEIY